MTKSTKKTTTKAAGDEKPATKKKAVAKKTAATAKTTATAKPALKKKVAKKRATPKKKATTAKAAVPRKKVVASTTAKRPAGVISAAQRHAMIAEAAYLRAEAHGFVTDSHTDWVYAESEIDARLARDGILVKH